MSGNLWGNIFRVMTFGESHGPYIGVVIDGVKPNIPIDVEEIQRELNRRRPGQSDIVTPRNETDQLEIISGVFEGKTTGTPICILIKNRDQRSKDYSHLNKILRPGHAAFTYLQKYGIFDYRGGGRASGRETAARVAAGAIAKQFLRNRGIEIVAFTRQIGNIRISDDEIDYTVIEKNQVRAPNLQKARQMVDFIKRIRSEGDSVGGMVEIRVSNCPPGLGEPVFNKLEADLAGALMSIGAVKGFEIGAGFEVVQMKGSENNDTFYFDKKEQKFGTVTNNAGGILGGISNGEELVMRIAVKPPSSIGKRQKSVDIEGLPIEFEIAGRHDPCIVPRIVPVAEAMVALVLIDHILMQERISENDSLSVLREKINTIDTQLLLLFAQRLQLIKEIGRIKEAKQLPVEDEEREKELRENWSEVAHRLNLPEEMIQPILSFLLHNSKAMQKDIVK